MEYPTKKLVVDCYADVYFAGLCGHENPQNPICGKSITGFVVTFDSCIILSVSKLHTKIDCSTLDYKHGTFFCYARELLNLESLIRELI